MMLLSNLKSTIDFKNKLQGLFMGQLVGDALGTRYEFMNSEKARKNVHNDILNCESLEILGGGPFRLKMGQYTDDSELALGIWESLVVNKKYNGNDISKKFHDWFNSNPFDIGQATRNAFQNSPNHDKMKKNAHDYNMESLSNGCLMKISPIGALLFIDKDNINDALLSACARDVCELTNPNPICVDMCIAYVNAINIAITCGNVDDVFDIAMKSAKMELTKAILNDSLHTNKIVKLSESKTVTPDSNTMGYIGIAFQNAFFQLKNANSFQEAMLSTICIGGDVDTNCCIAGALYGACFGIDCIPSSWVNTIVQFKQTDIDRLNAYSPLNHMKIFHMIEC